jgi:hypothetical protein
VGPELFQGFSNEELTADNIFVFTKSYHWKKDFNSGATFWCQINNWEFFLS